MDEDLISRLLDDAELKPLTQKEAIFQFVVEALQGVVPEEGIPLRELVTTDIRAIVRKRLYEGFKDGTILYETEGKTDSQLKKYSSNIISNWLIKDRRFD